MLVPLYPIDFVIKPVKDDVRVPKVLELKVGLDVIVFDPRPLAESVGEPEDVLEELIEPVPVLLNAIVYEITGLLEPDTDDVPVFDPLIVQVPEGLEEPDFDWRPLKDSVGLAVVVLEILIEDVPVLEPVIVLVELTEPVAVFEINAEYVWAGEEDELLERVALFVLDALFGPVLVVKAEADGAAVAHAENEYPEDRVLVFEGAEV